MVASFPVKTSAQKITQNHAFYQHTMEFLRQKPQQFLQYFDSEGYISSADLSLAVGHEQFQSFQQKYTADPMAQVHMVNKPDRSHQMVPHFKATYGHWSPSTMSPVGTVISLRDWTAMGSPDLYFPIFTHSDYVKVTTAGIPLEHSKCVTLISDPHTQEINLFQSSVRPHPCVTLDVQQLLLEGYVLIKINPLVYLLADSPDRQKGYLPITFITGTICAEVPVNPKSFCIIELPHRGTHFTWFYIRSIDAVRKTINGSLQVHVIPGLTSDPFIRPKMRAKWVPLFSLCPAGYQYFCSLSLLVQEQKYNLRHRHV
jgi:hypothetical protein